MSIDINKLWVFRIIPFENLEENLVHGLYCKHANKTSAKYLSIGSKEVIDRRSSVVVKCFPDTVVNDFVPFYFSVRTPMLYNIITGMGVVRQAQENIIYLCCKVIDLTTNGYKWCYTNGNAATAITKFYTDLSGIENNLDWHSIKTKDFRDENADGDEDRKRKKHSEFLVHNHVPANLIKSIVVINQEQKTRVEDLLTSLNLNIPVFINPQNKFYF